MRCRFAGEKCASAICFTIITTTRSPLLLGQQREGQERKKREKERHKGRGREGDTGWEVGLRGAERDRYGGKRE